MENKIFLYSGVYDWNVQEILEKMESIGADSDITFRMNSGGGSVFAAQGWLKDMKLRKGKNIGSIEGNASSMAFMLALNMDKVVCLETSKALIHRAFMWIENEEGRKLLADINEQFRQTIVARLNVPALEKRLGMSLDAFLYAGEKNEVRHEVYLNADDMVAIGLVAQEDVLKITPDIAADLGLSPTAMFDNYREPIQSQNILQTNNNNNNMETPDLNAVKMAAKQEEQARVAAWMVFAEVDLAKVQAGIESGKEISMKEMGEFMLAKADAGKLKTLEAQSQADITPSAEEIASKQKEYATAEAELYSELGLK